VQERPYPRARSRIRPLGEAPLQTREPVSEPLWQPSAERIRAANLTAFRSGIESKHGCSLGDYAALHRWSVEEPERFWSSVWEFTGVRSSARGARVVEDPGRMPGARWFPDARLNYAENLLRRRDESPALIFRNEAGVRCETSHADLYADVSRWVRVLHDHGIVPGDRVAAFLPNLPETIVAMLATASLGATWSSCSPDFGVPGVIDRFGQIAPRFLFTSDGYFYAGRRHDVLDKVRALCDAIPSIEHVAVVPYASETPDLRGIPGAMDFSAAIRDLPAEPIDFVQLPFDHPLAILYSSGTTGTPKCIVHGAGGTLLQHLKEQRLHVDVKDGDRIFYFTTCGWMMWNWLVSALASEATLLLYDGSPFHAEPAVLFDLAAEEDATIFGTSAKYIDAAAKAGLAPARTHDLPALRTILSTGSPLVAESFDYVYEQVHPDVCLSSISGGTDIVSCFVGGDPTGPVWRGEIQARCLGMAVEVFDESGRPVVGEKGELVCTKPFPSMPLGFWNDANGARYHAAYFEKHPGVWSQGDFAELTPHGGVIIHGRSDAVLNPGGVRIGTAEIYRQVERIDAVLESLVIGQEWDGDTRVVLFVRLRDGITLDEGLVDEIRRRVRQNASPRHVPARVIAVADIPRTRSGKIVELAVRDVVHGHPVRNREALANPEALDLFSDLPDLAH
jgi:acetoacetyl-CoA synthetase